MQNPLIIHQKEFDIVVVQKPPIVRTVAVTFDHPSHRQVSRYRLAFPWQVFVATYKGFYFRELRVAFSNKCLTDIDQDIFFPHLWNTYQSLQVCMPYVMTDVSQIPEQQINKAITAFWSSPFLYDSGVNQLYRQSYCEDERVSCKDKRGFIDWKKWQENSLKNPNFATQVSWIRYGPLSALINYIKDKYLQGTFF